MEKKRVNPIQKLWSIIGTLGGVISLSSLVPDLITKLGHWKGFIGSIISSYQDIVHPIFHISLLPIFELTIGKIPLQLINHIGDYLIFGSLFSFCAFRGGTAVITMPEGTPMPMLQHILLRIASVLMLPLILAVLVYDSTMRPQGELRSNARQSLSWIGAVLLGVTILLSINTQLNA